MVKVIIPVVVMMVIILCKKIPKIGGNIHVALIVAGVLSLITGGVYSVVEWAGAWIDGINRIAWVIALSIVGSVYAETQVKLGTMETIMGALKARFQNSPRALTISIVLALVVAGSLLGDAIAASTVIGVLTIGVLADMKLSGEKICAIIVMGASAGSIMPPISQAFALSSSLVEADPDAVVRIGYGTISVIVVFVCLYVGIFMVTKDVKLSEDSIAAHQGQTASQILRKNWTTLIPLFVLIVIIFFRTVSVPGIQFDFVPEVLGYIMVGENTSLVDALGQITILNGLTNGIVLSLLFVAVLAFFFPKVRCDWKDTLSTGIKNVNVTVKIQLCAAFMLGSFYAGGQIEAVQVFAQGLNSNVLKLGGAFALVLMGMLTGSQSTSQNVVFSFFGPALLNSGVSKPNTAVAGAHLATAGQGLPPADLTTFAVAGIVGGLLGKKVDPLKSMFYCMPMCLLMAAIGILFLYI